jgi:hypothetical protein
MGQTHTAGQATHLALVKSLRQGTEILDETRFQVGDQPATDVSVYDGHIYANKPPGLAFLTFPVYVALDSLGVELINTRMYWALGLVANVLPAALLLLLVRWVGEQLAQGFGTITAVTLGLGTLMLIGEERVRRVVSCGVGIAVGVLPLLAFNWWAACRRDRDWLGRSCPGRTTAARKRSNAANRLGARRPRLRRGRCGLGGAGPARNRPTSLTEARLRTGYDPRSWPLIRANGVFTRARWGTGGPFSARLCERPARSSGRRTFSSSRASSSQRSSETQVVGSRQY